MALPEHVDTVKRYQRYFKKLIELERREEMDFHLNEILSMPGKQRQKKGRAILYLTGKNNGSGIGGVQLVRLTGIKELPETEIGIGDLVILSSGQPNGEEPQAFVTEKSPFHLVVAYNVTPPPYVYRKGVRIDLFANDVSFQRMLDALFMLKPHQIISDLLLLDRTPRMADEQEEGKEVEQFSVKWHNRNLNPSQQQAVKKSLEAKDIFLIHGPPGTGKTTTLIESICQHRNIPLKLLATGDSNTAVDNMVEKLLQYNVRVLRIGNPARLNPKLASTSLDHQLQEDIDYQQAIAFREQIAGLRDKQHEYIIPSGPNRRGMSDQDIIKYAKRGGMHRGVHATKIQKMAQWLHAQHKINKLQEEIGIIERRTIRKLIQNAEVVCATNVSAGSDVLADYRFDIAFIDEATQSIEPSCLIPMVRAKKWILAGDHKQLPPTVLSREAQALLHTLFERWMEKYEDKISQLLNIQYRMHDDIMRFSNEQFYKGRLLSAPSVKRNDLTQLSGFIRLEQTDNMTNALTDPDKPVVFWNIEGQDRQIKDSFSYSNISEQEAVLEAVKALMGCRLFPEDIGIISPYEQQVNQLKEKLGDTGIDIKTVDGFQGREKEVIVISFVRANESGQLGFLTDYRRLNVALTRAKRKLILIGNAPTLRNDAHYKKLLERVTILDYIKSIIKLHI
jgi:predicted DNA helicase